MNRIEKLIFPPDLLSLPKDVLERTVAKIDGDTSQSVSGLAAQIWRYVGETNDTSPLTWVIEHVFAGKTGVAWFRFDDSRVVNTARTRLSEGQVNFFEQVTPWRADQLDVNRPAVIGAAPAVLAGRSVTVVRLALRLPDTRSTDGVGFEKRAVMTIVTMILSPDDRCIELRCNSQAIPRVIPRISRLLGIPESNLNQQIIAPFAERAEEFADRLGGKLWGTKSKPDTSIRGLSDEQIDVIVQVLSALDQAIADPDSVDLNAVIAGARESLSGGGVDRIPFAGLILANAQTIGLTADEEKDAREGSLYRWLRPVLNHHGGVVRFTVNEADGTTGTHTVRLGATTNSVAFYSKATETAIAAVRRVLFEMEDGEEEEAV